MARRMPRACQLCRVAVPRSIGRGGANIVAIGVAIVDSLRLGLRLVRVSLFGFNCGVRAGLVKGAKVADL